MIKNILKFISLFTFSISFSQLKPINQEIKVARINNGLELYDIFHEKNTQKIKSLEGKEIKDYSNIISLSINKEDLKRLYNNKPNYYILKIPYNNKEIEIELVKKDDVFTKDFKVVNGDNIEKEIIPGLFYEGIIKNEDNSLVAISVFHDEISGVVSSNKYGDVIIGKEKNSEDYTLSSSQINENKDFKKCKTDTSNKNKILNKVYTNKSIPLVNDKLMMTTYCVRSFFEIGYEIYEKNDYSLQKTYQWIAAIFNNVHSIYKNDYIRIAISSLMIWDKSDPYGQPSDGDDYWNKFKNKRPSFNGDFAFLIKVPYNESYASIDGLCTNDNYGFAFADIDFKNLPNFSWSVTVIAHEIGHILGSQHTHACAWNGNYTAIEGCSEPEGICELGPIPYDKGGTIMGYCNNMPGVGINLANGFGQQPSAKMRQTINRKSCLTTDGSKTCNTTIDSVTYELDFQNLYIKIHDNEGAFWKYNLYKYGQNKNDWKNTSSRNIKILNLDKNSYYVLEVANKCSEYSSSRSIKNIIDTYNYYCDGDFYYDTGGPNKDYSSNEHIIKTFKPKITGQKVTLEFLEFNIEQAYYDGNDKYAFDFMNIYNGNSVNSTKLFENGSELAGNKIPGPFKSTDESGAITIEFESNLAIEDKGWKAKVDCGILKTNDYNFNIYPNPTSDNINIISKNLLKKYQVIDINGQLVFQKDNVNTKNIQINLKEYSKGIYIIKLYTNNEIFSKKISKK